MKKIVANSIVVGSQLMVGALFLVGLFNSNTDENMVAVVENNNLSKMADAVNVMFISDTANNVFLDEEKVTEEVTEEQKEEEDTKKEEVKKEEIVEEFKEETKIVVEEVQEEIKQEDTSNNYLEEEPVYNVLRTYTGNLTGYGPDCYGCSGKTASGYDVRNTSTYTDEEFGEVRIVAADKSIPFYTIVRISNIPNTDPIIAIVLDTGGAVGFNKHTLFDLLFPSEAVAMGKTSNVTFEILRDGRG